MRFKIFKECNKKIIREEDRILIDYEKIKISSHSLSYKYNYNLLKKYFNSLIIIFTINQN